MRVALFVDTSEGTMAGMMHIRTGVIAFLDALPPQHEVMIVSTGRQTRLRVPPTTDRKKLKDAASGIFSEGGATPLMDSLLDMNERFMRKADDRWPVFVIITGDGAESSAGANEKKFNDWVRTLPSRGLVAHGIALKYRGGGTPEIVASHVVQTAGGRYDFMNTSNSLPDKLRAIGGQLARDFERTQTKYEIAFLADSVDSRPIAVGVAREGVVLEITNGRLR
jgi:Mg-chelatase subunit ChlD